MSNEKQIPLRYAYEVRGAADYFEEIEDVKIPAEMLKLAQHMLDNKAGDCDPTTFVDHYETVLVELFKHKQAGMPQEREPDQRRPKNVINLMDALSAASQQRRAPRRCRRPPAKSSAPERPLRDPRRGHEVRVIRVPDQTFPLGSIIQSDSSRRWFIGWGLLYDNFVSYRPPAKGRNTCPH
jgi:hypothetical protein